MKRKQAILLIGIFIIITVLLPVYLLLTNLLSDRTNTENQEYRELAAMPSLTDTGLDELFPSWRIISMTTYRFGLRSSKASTS